MSKRITLTDFEIEQIVVALKQLRNEGNGIYQVTVVGRHWYDDLVSKFVKSKSQHPRSVETLNVSGNGDKSSIAQRGKS